jgi:hypothetical protein
MQKLRIHKRRRNIIKKHEYIHVQNMHYNILKNMLTLIYS